MDTIAPPLFKSNKNFALSTSAFYLLSVSYLACAHFFWPPPALISLLSFLFSLLFCLLLALTPANQHPPPQLSPPPSNLTTHLARTTTTTINHGIRRLAPDEGMGPLPRHLQLSVHHRLVLLPSLPRALDPPLGRLGPYPLGHHLPRQLYLLPQVEPPHRKRLQVPPRLLTPHPNRPDPLPSTALYRPD